MLNLSNQRQPNGVSTCPNSFFGPKISERTPNALLPMYIYKFNLNCDPTNYRMWTTPTYYEVTACALYFTGSSFLYRLNKTFLGRWKLDRLDKVFAQKLVNSCVHILLSNRCVHNWPGRAKIFLVCSSTFLSYIICFLVDFRKNLRPWLAQRNSTYAID